MPALLEKGFIKAPVPVKTLPIGRIEDAFRLIGLRKHAGKIVRISPLDVAVTATTAPASPLGLLLGDGTCLV